MPIDNYYFSVVKKDPEKLENKRAKERIWQANNRQRVNQKQAERTRANKAKAIEYLGGACQKCGGIFHMSVYDFHHRDPSEKEFEPCRLKFYSWGKLKIELDKCDLLCSNCHREIHYKLNEENSVQI